MTTLRARSTPAVTTRTVPWSPRPAMAQMPTSASEPMYQTGITAPSIRPP